MEEWVCGTTIGDLKGLSQGSIPPFPTKNQGVNQAQKLHRVKGCLMDALQAVRYPLTEEDS